MSQKKIFVLLSSGYFICSLSMSIIAPFFPPFAKDREINEIILGVIYSADPIATMLTSLILGKILNDVLRSFFLTIKE